MRRGAVVGVMATVATAAVVMEVVGLAPVEREGLAVAASDTAVGSRGANTAAVARMAGGVEVMLLEIPFVSRVVLVLQAVIQ